MQKKWLRNMILLLEEIQSWNTEAYETGGNKNGRQRKREATKTGGLQNGRQQGGNREATGRLAKISSSTAPRG